MKIHSHNARWIVVETVPATVTLDLVELPDGSHPSNAMGFRCDREAKTRGETAYLFMVEPVGEKMIPGGDSVNESAAELSNWPLAKPEPIKFKDAKDFMDHGAV